MKALLGTFSGRVIRRYPASSLSILASVCSPSSFLPLKKKVGVAETPNLCPAFPHRVDAGKDLLVGEAGIEAFLGEADLLRQAEERGLRVIDERPLSLLLEEEVDDRGNTLRRSAMGEHDRRGCDRIEREFAEDVIDLAGVDSTCLEGLKISALKAGNGCRSSRRIR